MNPKINIKSSLAKRDEVVRALGTFSPLEKWGFLLALAAASISVLFFLYSINDRFMVEIPAAGGTLLEGELGTPHYINPLLAVYRGLMKKDESGNLVPDLASTYNISDDGLTYTFTLKDATFDDGEKITADDVVFTVTSARDTVIKSPKRVSFEGVTVKKIDDKTVAFVLHSPFGPFIESTTLGIMPKHVWEKILPENWNYSELNGKDAVGSGFYQISSISKDSSGIPTSYKLTAVKGKEAPYISKIIFYFYKNESDLVDAYKSKEIDTVPGISPEAASALKKNNTKIYTAPLPRVFGLFFNPNQNQVFTDTSFRKAVDLAIDKDKIVREVLGGFGSVLSGPMPDQKNLYSGEEKESIDHVGQARALLEKNGWKLGEDGIYIKNISKKETIRASFEIATNNVGELRSTTEEIVKELKAAGIEAVEKIYETGNLNKEIIRPRKFEALFFGQVIGSQSDLYAFWHSSQRNDPGLNISGYANTKTDKLLDDALVTTDTTKLADILDKFSIEIQKDMPASFVYSPSFIYVVREGIPGISIGKITNTEDRFSNVDKWYINTDKVWKIFAKN